MMDWKTITVKYPNRCVECRIVIKEGETALYLQGLGLKHKECPTGLELPKDDTRMVIIDADDKKRLGL